MLRAGGPAECSPGREAGVWKAQSVQPRRGVRLQHADSHAPTGLALRERLTPRLRVGLHSIGPTGLLHLNGYTNVAATRLLPH
jgi:hypothetical protein